MKDGILKFCGFVSFTTSSISFITSFISLFPQILQTYRDKNVEGISPWFLSSWLFGDVMSLVGAVMTKQLLFQILLAVYFLFNDLVICSQYYYYGVLHNNQLPNYTKVKSRNTASTSIATSVLTFAHTIGKVNASNLESTQQNNSSSVVSVGHFLSWMGALFYVGSRLPQLIKNYKRKSTNGISPFLFLTTFTSNITYNISILTNEKFITNSNRKEFIMNELPFIVGNVGTIIFDIVYFYQHYLLYERSESQSELSESEELDDFSVQMTQSQ